MVDPIRCWWRTSTGAVATGSRSRRRSPARLRDDDAQVVAGRVAARRRRDAARAVRSDRRHASGDLRTRHASVLPVSLHAAHHRPQRRSGRTSNFPILLILSRAHAWRRRRGRRARPTYVVPGDPCACCRSCRPSGGHPRRCGRELRRGRGAALPGARCCDSSTPGVLARSAPRSDPAVLDGRGAAGHARKADAAAAPPSRAARNASAELAASAARAAVAGPRSCVRARCRERIAAACALEAHLAA